MKQQFEETRNLSGYFAHSLNDKFLSPLLFRAPPPSFVKMATGLNSITRLADTFAISCGTITLDPVHAKLLLVRWKKNDETCIPKGRKNIDEALEDAAIRETYELTGVRVSLLPSKIPTLAYPAGDVEPESELSTEPVAFTQRVMGNGTLKLIFWYVGQGDSTAAHDLGAQEDEEDYEPVWVGLKQAAKALTFRDEMEIVQRVLRLYSLPFLYPLFMLSGNIVFEPKTLSLPPEDLDVDSYGHFTIYYTSSACCDCRGKRAWRNYLQSSAEHR